MNDVNLTEIMQREDIEAVKSWLGGLRFSVALHDGRFGVGRTVGEALDNAKASNAVNIKAAA